MPKTKSLPRGVAVVGAGMSKFGAFAEKNTRGNCLPHEAHESDAQHVCVNE